MNFPGRDWINLPQPGMVGCGSAQFDFVLPLPPQGRISGGMTWKAKKQGLQIKSSAANEDRHFPPAKYFTQASCAQGKPIRDAASLPRIKDIDEVMRYPEPVSNGWFGRANIQLTENCHRINRDYLSIDPARQYHGHLTLAACRGPGNDPASLKKCHYSLVHERIIHMSPKPWNEKMPQNEGASNRWRQIRPFPNSVPRLAFIDFDGTLSLIRAGWMPIMRAQMFKAIRPLDHVETDGELMDRIETWIQENNGKPTWRQMERLHLEVEGRNGVSHGWKEHLREFSNQLMALVNPIKDKLRAKSINPSAVCVPGAHELLKCLQLKGMELHLVSGTALEDVVEELELLGLSGFFQGRVHGPTPANPDFSKSHVLEALVPDPAERTNVLGIGDGPVEISLVAQNGGLAVGVARSECGTRLDAGVAKLLGESGAHALVHDFKDASKFIAWLWSRLGESP